MTLVRGVVTAAVAACCGASAVPAQGLSGYWSGRMVHDAAGVAVSFAFRSDAPGAWLGRFTSLTQRALEYPLDTVVVTGPLVHLVLGSGSTVFDGSLRGDSITGVLRDAEAGEGTFALHRAVAPSYPYRREDVTVANGAVRVAGSLYVPGGRARHAAVVILQGAGPETRWGTARYLADRFARAGVAALITDKRGTGASSGDWRRASFADLADDALASVRLLARRRDIDPGEIGLFGPSQGAMVAPLATARARAGEIAFIVAGAPLGDSVYKQDLWRVGRIMREAQASGMHTAEEVARAMSLYRRFVDVARSGGQGSDAFQRASDSVAEQHWFRMLEIPPPGHWVWAWYEAVGNFDPAPFWELVRVPALLLYGDREEIVPVAENLAGVEHALDRGGNTRYAAVLIPHARHNWTIHPEPGEPFFWWHQSPGIDDLVVAWVLRQTGPGDRHGAGAPLRAALTGAHLPLRGAGSVAVLASFLR